MKKTVGFFSFAAIAGVLMFGAPALRAQTAQPQPAAKKDATCDAAAEAKYDEWRANRKDHQDVAYAAGKIFLDKCPNHEYAPYVKKFNDAYDKAERKIKLADAINAKQYDQAFTLGKDVVAAEPDDLQNYINLGYAGYQANAAGNKKNNAAATEYAKKAIQLIGSGKTLEKWQPFKDKDETLAYLNFAVGELAVETDPKTAEQYYLKSLKYTSVVKDQPVVYSRIAYTYIKDQYTVMASDYDKTCSGKDPTPQCKVMLDNVYGVTDRVIDAYARAVALSNNKPEYAKARDEWKQKFDFFYKFRNNNDAKGEDQYVASVLQKPLPDPFTPAPIPAVETPTTGGTTTSTTTSTTPPPATTPTTTTSTSTTKPTPSTTKPSTKPTTKPTPPTKKP